MSFELTLHAGPHRRGQVPISVPFPASSKDTAYAAGPGIPAQAHGGILRLIVPALEPGEGRTFSIEPSATPADSLSLSQSAGSLAFSQGGQLITRYHFSEQGEWPIPSKPYFYPLNLDGLNLTRHVAAKNEAQPGIDHTHHRSLWASHGSVNGVDLWEDNPGHGFQRHQSFTSLFFGPVCAGFEEQLLWESASGEKLLEETRAFTVWSAIPGGRFLDLEVTLKAAFGDVTFGDTKEGGLCALRLKEPLQGDKTGLITNASGGQSETECWGQRSPWVDYSGELEGKKVGIAVFDHPRGFRYPTHWHVRDYGLFAANPFAWHDYKSGWSQDGSFLLKRDRSITFRY